MRYQVLRYAAKHAFARTIEVITASIYDEKETRRGDQGKMIQRDFSNDDARYDVSYSNRMRVWNPLYYKRSTKTKQS